MKGAIMTEPTLKEKLSVKEKWIRLIFMIFFVLVTFLTRILIWVIAAFQFIYTMLVGKPAKTLLPFSESLSKYIYQIMEYLTYVSEQKPFPFEAWPTTKEKHKKIEK